MAEDDEALRSFPDWRENRGRTIPERIATLEEQVRQLKQMQIDAGGWREAADRKLDLLIAKADEARGRTETLKMLITGLPSAVWMLTVGGAFAFVAWLWHQSWPTSR